MLLRVHAGVRAVTLTRGYFGTVRAWRPLGIWRVLLLAALLAAAPSSAVLGDDGSRNHERAETLRQQSRDRAVSGLGYPTVEDSDDTPPRTTDYDALSSAIERLARIVERMRGPVPGLPTADAPPSDLRAVYGPDGPTERSVRLILEYRLMVGGNPRLKVGAVDEGETAVRATVVTRDDSLVEEYEVDKATGVWRPVRPATP